MSERVLVIDPGEMVGYCVGTIGKPYVPQEESERLALHGEPWLPTMTVDSHGISALKEFALKLWDVAGDYDTIVYETWRLRADMAKKMIGNDFQASQLIGMIRLLAWQHPHVRLVSSAPGVKKTGVKVAAAHLPKVHSLLESMPKRHDDAHDGDAVMHLVGYWWKQISKQANRR